MTTKTLDNKARRITRRFDCFVRKSRSKDDFENRGGYMIFDRDTGFPVAGFQYCYSAEAVIEHFTN